MATVESHPADAQRGFGPGSAVRAYWLSRCVGFQLLEPDGRLAGTVADVRVEGNERFLVCRHHLRRFTVKADAVESVWPADCLLVLGDETSEVGNGSPVERAPVDVSEREKLSDSVEAPRAHARQVLETRATAALQGLAALLAAAARGAHRALVLLALLLGSARRWTASGLRRARSGGAAFVLDLRRGLARVLLRLARALEPDGPH
jgi:hypothetical protein